jgi:Nucleotidyl transferase AbiEii toxin, Type IV TA system
VIASKHQSDWARLFRIACALVRQVNSKQVLIEHWTVGGGTALMLQIDHHEGHDIDIFIDHPQLLPLLDPQKRNFHFETLPSDNTDDGARFLKLAFDEIGEVDFIVGAALTTAPTKHDLVEGETILLDTVPEIITKKIHYRGSGMKPRDIFDVAAAAEQHADPIIRELKRYRVAVARAIMAMDRLKSDFVRGAIARLQIKDRYAAIARSSLDKAKELLEAV